MEYCSTYVLLRRSNFDLSSADTKYSTLSARAVRFCEAQLKGVQYHESSIHKCLTINDFLPCDQLHVQDSVLGIV